MFDNMINLSYTSCCALKEGCRKNLNIVNFLNSYLGRDIVVWHLEILGKNTELAFPASNKGTAEIFAFIAEAEKSRLLVSLSRDKNFKLPCGCSVENHIAGLTNVLTKIQPVGRA